MHVQPDIKCSIHLLDFKKTRKLISKDSSQKINFNELIQKIVDEHNGVLPNKTTLQKNNSINGTSSKLSEKNKSVKTARKTSEKSKGIFTLIQEDLTKHEKFEFKIKAYEKSHDFEPGASQALETHSKVTKIAHLLFFYRENPREIFAITTAHAFHVVHSYADFTFPFSVAKKILDPNGITSITRRCLFGNATKETLQNPDKAQLFSLDSLYYLVEKFTCYIRYNSSMYNFLKTVNSTVETENEETSKNKSTYSMDVNLGNIRLRKAIPLTKYSDLLNLFSGYVNNRAHSTKIPVIKNEDSLAAENAARLFEFLSYMQLVDITKNTELDNCLLDQLRRAFKEETQETGIAFRHKYLDEYLTAGRFTIHYGKKSNKKSFDFAHPPTLEEILKVLMEVNKKLLENEMDFRNAFSTSTLEYESNSLWPTQATQLVRYLEGQVTFNDCNYFKMKGLWYELRMDYQCLVDYNFRELVKTVLVTPQSEEWTWLNKPWSGTKRKGNILEEDIKKHLGLVQGARDVLNHLLKRQITYFKKEKDGTYRCLETNLCGEILTVSVIKKHRITIQDQILKTQKCLTDKEFKQFFKDDADAIILELLKKRTIIIKDKKQNWVKNPFLTQLKEDQVEVGPKKIKKKLFDGGKIKDFQELLQSRYHISIDTRNIMKEEVYNRSYLDNPPPTIAESGYLVFDQITPFGIEPCDVLRYSPTTTYLYHIKEKFGQHTRDACSQILNAAKEIRSALSLNQSTNFIDGMWERGTTLSDLKGKKDAASSSKEFRAKMKKQLEALSKDKFVKIFRDKKIVFVYACLTSQLSKESTLPTRLQVGDFKNIDNNPKELFQALVDQSFLDKQGRLTGKFYATKQAAFQLKGFDKYKDKILERLNSCKSCSKSTIAKLDLLHVAQELRRLGFEFRICEIPRSENSGSPNPGLITKTIDIDDSSKSKRKLEDPEDPPSKRKRTEPNPIPNSSEIDQDDVGENRSPIECDSDEPVEPEKDPTLEESESEETDPVENPLEAQVLKHLDAILKKKNEKKNQIQPTSVPSATQETVPIDLHPLQAYSQFNIEINKKVDDLPNNVISWDKLGEEISYFRIASLKLKIQEELWNLANEKIKKIKVIKANEKEIENWKNELGLKPTILSRFDQAFLKKAQPLINFNTFQRDVNKVLNDFLKNSSKNRLVAYTNYCLIYAYLQEKQLPIVSTGDQAIHNQIMVNGEKLNSLCNKRLENLGNTCWLNTSLQSIVSLDKWVMNPNTKPTPKQGTEGNENYVARCLVLEALRIFYYALLKEDASQWKEALDLFLKVLKVPGMPADFRLNSGAQQDPRAILNMILDAMGIGISFGIRRSASQDKEDSSEKRTTFQISLKRSSQKKMLKIEELAEEYCKAKQENTKWKNHPNHTVEHWIKEVPPILMLDFQRSNQEDLSEKRKGLCDLIKKNPKYKSLKEATEEDLLASVNRTLKPEFSKDKTTPFEFPKDGQVKMKIFGRKKEKETYQIVSFTLHEGKDLNAGHWVCCRKDRDGLWRLYSDNNVPKKLNDKELSDRFALCSQIILTKV